MVVRPVGNRPPPWAAADPRWRVKGPFPEGHVVLRLAGLEGLRYGVPVPDAGLAEVDRRGWDIQASRPGARLAVDGDRATAWSSGEERQGRGDFYRVRFPGPVEVARVSLALRDPYEFPMHVKLVGETEQVAALDVPFDEAAAYDRLFALLLHRPRDASLDLDVGPVLLRGIRVRITDTDPFWMP